MTVLEAAGLPGTRYPAGRVTRPMIGGTGPLASANFTMGYVVLDPEGGQVPWHNHGPEEAYFILSGTGELCVGAERTLVGPGQLAYVPSGSFHQLTNVGQVPLVMLYCCGQGLVLHGKQELEGTLPIAGRDVPPVPEGARPQRA